MIFPLIEQAALGAELLGALLFGVVFGIILERSGLGDARKLAAQFYLRDMTVLKVLFTALLTALLGLFWLSRLGLLDAAALRVPATYVLPQLVGGLLFGFGFVMAGLCPGTSCVAAAAGRGDGFAVLAGILGGTLLFAETFDGLEGFFYAGALGRMQLPGLLGASGGVVVFLIVILALGAFAGAEALERRFGFPAAPGSHPVAAGSRRRWVFVFALLLPALLAAVVGGSPLSSFHAPAMFDRTVIDGQSWNQIHPWQLAAWIMNRKDDLVIVDLRPEKARNRYHIPGARRLPAEGLSRNQLVVLVGPDEHSYVGRSLLLADLPPEHLYLLAGGMEGWMQQVLFPDLSKLRGAPAATLEAVKRASLYFGGEPRGEDPAFTRLGFAREGC